MAAPVVALDDIHKQFGGVHAVAGVSLEIRAGEVLGLVGENGAGKSTVVRMLAGAVVPDRGTLAIDGRPVRLHGPHDASERGISVIHQELALVESQTIAENLFLGRPRPRRGGLLDWAALRRRAAAACEELGHPLDVDKLVAEATVWERWATALVRALMVRSRVLVLDEPTAAMDDAGAREVHRAIRRARDGGSAVVLVSHRLHEVEALCDRVHAMRNGSSAGELAPGEVRRARLVALITGTDAPPARRARPAAATAGAEAQPPLLRVRELRSGSRLAQISFDVAPGEIVGVAGLVGSGRSRLLRVLGGAEPATGGTIAIDGRRVALRSPRAAARAGVALLPEDRLAEGLIPPLPVAQNINLGGRPSSARVPFVLRHGELRTRARRWIGELGIRSARPGGSAMHLSGGNQQKVMFARALDRSPRVLLLDEPTRGVDVGARAELTAVMRGLGASGAAVLVALSDLEELADLVDRAIVLREGRLVGELSGDELTRQRMLEVCYGGH
jgi:ribose transport system ATP-binding protein